MSPPMHVKAVCGFTSALRFSYGICDILCPGKAVMPLNDVNDFFFENSPKGNALQQGWGTFLVAMAAAQATTLFTNPEGTFLRKNLLIAYGITDLIQAAVYFKVNQWIQKENGPSLVPFIFLGVVEAAVYLHDAYFRPRVERQKH
eukprot:TRINITY_DN251_c0_g1_i1.p3 TRINITY_DN251_c0_g1~~TRINITY_DN251_c0_g1_i1.p3  ORF type:complete len:145 (+),score=56.39 TRINITY_DN251_c0_g1_i1:86-520(+)